MRILLIAVSLMLPTMDAHGEESPASFKTSIVPNPSVWSCFKNKYKIKNSVETGLCLRSLKECKRRSLTHEIAERSEVTKACYSSKAAFVLTYFSTPKKKNLVKPRWSYLAWDNLEECEQQRALIVGSKTVSKLSACVKVEKVERPSEGSFRDAAVPTSAQWTCFAMKHKKVEYDWCFETPKACKNSSKPYFEKDMLTKVCRGLSTVYSYTYFQKRKYQLSSFVTKAGCKRERKAMLLNSKRREISECRQLAANDTKKTTDKKETGPKKEEAFQKSLITPRYKWFCVEKDKLDSCYDTARLCRSMARDSRKRCRGVTTVFAATWFHKSEAKWIGIPFADKKSCSKFRDHLLNAEEVVGVSTCTKVLGRKHTKKKRRK